MLERISISSNRYGSRATIRSNCASALGKSGQVETYIRYVWRHMEREDAERYPPCRWYKTHARRLIIHVLPGKKSGPSRRSQSTSSFSCGWCNSLSVLIWKSWTSGCVIGRGRSGRREISCTGIVKAIVSYRTGLRAHFVNITEAATEQYPSGPVPRI